MKNKRTNSKLAALAVGAVIGSTAVGSSPNARIDFLDGTVQRGNSSSYRVWLNASDFNGNEVTNMTYFTETLPSFMQVQGHDIFSSGGNNSGVYLEGFLTGEDVSPSNVIENEYGSIGIAASSFPGPQEPNDKVIRYDFSVDPNTPLGPYSFGLVEGTRIKYGIVDQYFIPQQDLIPGSFTVIPNMQQFSADTQGPGVTVPGTNNDFDQDGDVDLGDWAEAQIRVSGR